MTRTQFANAIGSAGLILPACALVVLCGCRKPSFTPPLAGMPVNSPITVADGTMEVRTFATFQPPSATAVTINGGLDSAGQSAPGQACFIKIGPNGPYSVGGKSWIVTSNDENATISTPDNGKMVVAASTSAGTNISQLLDGVGYSFNVTFSPPKFTINGVKPPGFDCSSPAWPRCKVWIDYWVGTNASCPAKSPCDGANPPCPGYPRDE
jgi:hypothetical protein